MTFEEYAKEQGLYFTEDYVSDEFQIAQAAWEAAFNAGVTWALEQDADTLNKLQLTMEKSDED